MACQGLVGPIQRGKRDPGRRSCGLALRMSIPPLPGRIGYVRTMCQGARTEGQVTGESDGGRGDRWCRYCAAPLEHVLSNLGRSPLCESFITPDKLYTVEPFYPWRVRLCSRCFLAQLPEFVSPDEISTNTPTSRGTRRVSSSTHAS